MADSTNIPANTFDLVEIQVKQKPDALKRLLLDMLSRIEALERKVKALENAS